MKSFKTAMLVGAFALATTVSFAQVGGGAGTSGSAAVGTGNAGISGTTNMKSNTGVNANVGGTNAKAGADASGNTAIKKKSVTTTGSGAAGTAVNGSVK